MEIKLRQPRKAASDRTSVNISYQLAKNIFVKYGF
jgi:hypothetical protein